MDSNLYKLLNSLMLVRKQLSEQVYSKGVSKELTQKLKICDRLWLSLIENKSQENSKLTPHYDAGFWFVQNWRLDIEIIRKVLEL